MEKKANLLVTMYELHRWEGANPRNGEGRMTNGLPGNLYLDLCSFRETLHATTSS